jgi:hypothetical protein
MADLNKYNFIRWFSSCITDDPLEIPRIYVKDESYSTPILKVGETTTFYLNFNVAVNYSFNVYLMDDNQKVGTSLCLLTQLVIDTNVYEYYGSFVCPDVPDGIYRLGLYSGNDLMALSSPVEVIDNPTNTVLVKFRHGKNTFGFNYDLLPADWYQQFRLRITEADRQPQDTHEQYRSVTTNKLRNYDAKVDRYVKFETYFFDAAMHEAMEVMVSHDVIYIQNKKFTFKEAYKRTVDPSSRVFKGEFELWEDAFSQDQKFDNVNVETLVEMYFNQGIYQKNDCTPGHDGSFVEYPGLAGKYCSIVSQADAESKVTAAELILAQAYANAHGSCSVAALFNDQFDNWSGGLPVGWTIEAGSQNPSGITNNANRVSFYAPSGAWNSFQGIEHVNSWAPLVVPPGMTKMFIKYKIKIENLSAGDQVVIGVSASPGEVGSPNGITYFYADGVYEQQGYCSAFFTKLRLDLSILNPTGPHTAIVDYLIVEFVQFLP